jgi:hypothetical protein
LLGDAKSSLGDAKSSLRARRDFVCTRPLAVEGIDHQLSQGSSTHSHRVGGGPDLQNLRGGRVKLQSIIMPDMEFGNTEKGDALYAMELALSLEKLNNEKLLALHKVAEECDDPQMTDFVEGDFLGEQVRGSRTLHPLVSAIISCAQGTPPTCVLALSTGVVITCEHTCACAPQCTLPSG